MSSPRQSRLRAVLLAAIVAAGAGLCAQAEDIIWQCDFNDGEKWKELAYMPDVASHFMLTGIDSLAWIDDGTNSGRFCAEIESALGDRGWFSVNEISNDVLGARYVPNRWGVLRASFKMYAIRGWYDEDIPLYATTLPPSVGDDSKLKLMLILASGSIVNIDDKLALWPCEFEDEYGYVASKPWQINAGITNDAGTLVTRTVRLTAKGPENELASPARNWVEVEIEAVNDGSPHGLAYRIYIDGALACSEEDGATVFRARPIAADKNGITALGFGGCSYVDDIVFSSTTIDPLSGVRISPRNSDRGMSS